MKDELNNQIVETMFMVFRSMKDTMCYSSKTSHLTMIQLEALKFLSKHEHAQMKDFADYFSITMPTSTSLIDKLILAKLAQRKNYSKDRRIVKITITKSGKKLYNDAMRQRENKINKMLTYLSSEEKKDLLRIMSRILAKTQENEK